MPHEILIDHRGRSRGVFVGFGWLLVLLVFFSTEVMSVFLSFLGTQKNAI